MSARTPKRRHLTWVGPDYSGKIASVRLWRRTVRRHTVSHNPYASPKEVTYHTTLREAARLPIPLSVEELIIPTSQARLCVWLNQEEVLR